MSTPIILIAGAAGSGKDAFADQIQKHARCARIAQADPMKRFAMQVFGFTEDQLWGPSELRNAPDPRYSYKRDANAAVAAWDDAWAALRGSSAEIIRMSEKDRAEGLERLNTWYVAIREQHADRTLTPRTVLQTLGTEFGRALNPEMWSQGAIMTARKLLGGGYKYDRIGGLQEAPGEPPYDYVLVTDGRFPNEVLNVLAVGGDAILVTNPAPADAAVAVDTAGVKGHASEASLGGIPKRWWTAVVVNDKSQGLAALSEIAEEVLRDLNSAVRYSAKPANPVRILPQASRSFNVIRDY